MAHSHILFSITHHGFGHAAIAAAVMAQIQKTAPAIKITIMSNVPKDYFDQRLNDHFDYLAVGSDFGMQMLSPIKVDVTASHQQYLEMAAQWSDLVAHEQTHLKRIKPDLVVSNISPVSLAAAATLGILCVSLAPFNWRQIYQRYCASLPDAEKVLAILEQAYQAVECILKTTPHVADPLNASKEVAVGPICQLGQPQADILQQRLRNSSNRVFHRVGLIALGGLTEPLNLNAWPNLPGWLWLVDQTPPSERCDMLHFTAAEMRFLDLVFSVDLALTKPGYGTYTELACAGTNAVTLARPDWPETPFLNAFLQQHVNCVEISPQGLYNGELALAIEQVSTPHQKPRAQANGAANAAKHILALL
ncbi:hypothetical protein [Motilimonas pumila]|uniref:Glycosyl transferase family 28 C-terminal domain-containing protein n=1 Tax=Motilimonas pumila TaxID=2303987 RepID=A0A418YHI1_9GAMM|nr:hypothetical protein [Motilimonas pumila]RJG49556.1 hypothetical protein D1Z90_06255 [Motilimonas pumila]